MYKLKKDLIKEIPVGWLEKNLFEIKIKKI